MRARQGGGRAAAARPWMGAKRRRHKEYGRAGGEMGGWTDGEKKNMGVRTLMAGGDL